MIEKILEIENAKKMVVTDQTPVRELATDGRGEPSKPGLTPAEATGRPDIDPATGHGKRESA